jgi:nucleotide-binding universal stress UspA family protein
MNFYSCFIVRDDTFFFTMKRFKNILAILPENSPEEDVLAWAEAVTKAASARKVTVLRILEPILTEYPVSNSNTPSLDEERHILTTKISPMFPNLDLTVKVEIDSLLPAVLHELSSGDYDLVIVPLTDPENRNIVVRLSRKSPAGILAVPKKSKTPPSSILVGLDYSNLSILALEWAEAFASLSEGDSTRLEAVNTFKVPYSSRSTCGMDPRLLKDHLEKIAKRQLGEFLEDTAKQPSRWIPNLAESNMPGSFLATRANKSHTGLLVIGSHGKSTFKIALLGSHAADILRSSERPVLVVKKKNQTLGFLRNLLGHSD